MRIALVQAAGHPGDLEFNLDLMIDRIAAAATGGAELAIFPELFASGYNIGAVARQLAFPADGEPARRIGAEAKKHSIAVLYGYPEADSGSVANSAQLVDNQGQVLANYRKLHLFGDYEQNIFSRGSRFESAQVGAVHIGILICYDVEFPESVRYYAEAGVHLVAVPTALGKPYEFVAETLVPTRAYENQIYIAYCNHCGSEGNLSYPGNSCVAGPTGTVLARAAEREAMLFAEIDPDACRKARTPHCFLAERRSDLY